MQTPAYNEFIASLDAVSRAKEQLAAAEKAQKVAEIRFALTNNPPTWRNTLDSPIVNEKDLKKWDARSWEEVCKNMALAIGYKYYTVNSRICVTAMDGIAFTNLEAKDIR